MEQDLKKSLKVLLRDKNLPDAVCEAALEQLLNEFTKRGVSLEACWSTIANLENAFNRGPVVPISSNHVRVAKVLPLEIFIMYHLDYQSLGIELDIDEDKLFSTVRRFVDRGYSLTDLYQRAGQGHLTGGGVNWTTLDSEIRQLTPQVLSEELGLNHLQGREIVSVSYDIETRHLHVPTVLDAKMLPWFVPKPSVEDGLPRAWNWVQDRWGLPEFVHPAAVEIQNPRIELIGETTAARSKMDRLASFDHIVSPEIENVVSEILRRVTAHHELLGFISGSSDVLTLTHREFEMFVGQLYQRTGFETEVTRPSRDGGFDVIAISDSKEQSGLLIQAKHTRGVVGIRVIRELLGARRLADEALRQYMLVVCTTGRFSRPAKDAQKQMAMELELIDYDNLQQKLKGFKEVGVKDIVKDALNFLKRGKTLDL